MQPPCRFRPQVALHDYFTLIPSALAALTAREAALTSLHLLQASEHRHAAWHCTPQPLMQLVSRWLNLC